MKNKLLKAKFIILLVILMSGEIAPVITDTRDRSDSNLPRVLVNELPNPRNSIDVIRGRMDSVLLDERVNYERTRFYSENLELPEDTSFKVGDSGSGVKDYEVSGKQKIVVKSVVQTFLEKETDITTNVITDEVEKYQVPGLLNVVHSLNTTGATKVFLDSKRDDYTLDGSEVVNALVDEADEVLESRKSFGLVVFVSDYKNRGIEKLQTNKVWLQTYSRLQQWLVETSDYSVMLVNEYATPNNIMGILAAAQMNPEIFSMGITFVTHGVNSVYGHGVLIHQDGKPRQLRVTDGRIFSAALNKTGVAKLSKMTYTNVHACYLIDEYEEHGEDSVLGFFEKQNYNQVLTGYRGLTYLNTRFVLSLESMLASGIYVFPKRTEITPVVLTYDDGNGTRKLGKYNIKTVRTFTISLEDGNLPKKYFESFDGDESLFVTDINNSPAPEGKTSSVYTDISVYENLGVAPPSYFPVEGTRYSFENHKSGSWITLNANDDQYFYFSKGTYQGYQEEFSSQPLGWTASSSNIQYSDGYVILGTSGNHEAIEEQGVTRRPLNVKASVTFKFDDGSTGTNYIIFKGDKVDSLSVTGAERRFGIYIQGNYIHPYNRGTLGTPIVSSFVNYRQYVATIEIIGDVATMSISSPEDPDFYESFNIFGVGDITNPRLYLSSIGRNMYVDMYKVEPIIQPSSFQPHLQEIYEDSAVELTKVSGNGGTSTYTLDRSNGISSVKAGSTTDPDWLRTNPVLVDSENRYLVFNAKIPSSATSVKIQFKAGSQTYTVSPWKFSPVNELAFVKDNIWHTYIVDIYDRFGITDPIYQISFQAEGGIVLFDSVYVTGSLTSAKAMVRNSYQTLDKALTQDPNASYRQSFEGILDSSSFVGDGEWSSGIQTTIWSDDFNDNSLNPTWTKVTDPTVDIVEQNSRLEIVRLSGGSGWQSARVKKSINSLDLVSITNDVSVYYPKMGIAWMMGFYANGQEAWRIQLGDSWISATGYAMLRAYKPDGTLISQYYTGPGGVSSSTENVAFTASVDQNTGALTLQISGSESHIKTFTGLGEWTTVELGVAIHQNYYQSSTYVRHDNYVETHRGTVSGPTNNAKYVEGIAGQAIQFNKDNLDNGGTANDYVTYSSDQIIVAHDITISAWIKPYNNYVASASAWDLIGRQISNTGAAWEFGPEGWGNSFAFKIYDSNGAAYIVRQYNFSFEKDTWYHVVAVVRGSFMGIYINGELVASRSDVSTNFILRTAKTLEIGRNFKGTIDEFKLYSAGLTEKQIWKEFSEFAIVLDLPFDGTLTDQSPNMLDGTGSFNFVEGAVGQAIDFRNTNDYINLGNPKALQITGSATYSFWINLNSYYARQNPFGKSFGAEGTFTIETYGRIRQYWGTAGTNSQPYTEALSTSVVPLNTWTHFVFVRDAKTKEAKWYINGVLDSTKSNIGLIPTSTSTYAFTIGNNYASSLDGMLDELKIFNFALSPTQIGYLYNPDVFDETSPQKLTMEPSTVLKTSDIPSYTMVSTISDSQGTKLSEYYVTAGTAKYGVKLDNGVWKTLSGAVIPQISYVSGETYTIDFYVDDSATKLEIFMSSSLNQSAVIASYSIGSKKIVPSMIAQDGYQVSSKLTLDANINTELYSANTANGAISQGAFALKFSRETQLQTIDVTKIYETYSTPGDNFGFYGLLNDLGTYLVCGEVDVDIATCSPPGGSLFMPKLYQSGGFEDAVFNARQLNLRLIGSWTITRWFDDLIKEFNTGKESRIQAHKIGNNYYYYRNIPLTSISVDVEINGINGQEFRLDKLTASGAISQTWTTTTYPFKFTITNLDPRDHHFFYAQFSHSADLSKYSISITPTEKVYNYAYRDYLEGNNKQTVLESVYTGMDGKLPASQNNVSFVKYRWDSNGNPLNPTYSVLPQKNGKFYLNSMIAIGGLPKAPLQYSDPITAETYSATEKNAIIGEKLVGGSTYWDTINGASATQLTYVETNSTDGKFMLNDNEGYMASFVLRNRYKSQVTLELYSTDKSNLALYLDNTAITPVVVDRGIGTMSEQVMYRYYLTIGTDPISFLVKVDAHSTTKTSYFKTVTYSPFLSISVQGYSEPSMVFKEINQVEEMRMYGLSNGKLTTIILGSGFKINTLNERLDAQSPPNARQSVQNAVNSEPTKNKIFNVQLLLEKIVAQFSVFRNDVRTKIYNVLTFTNLWGKKEYKLADIAWGLIDNFGFGSIERIINWFNDEERQTMLSNLLTSDPSLKSELNYGSDTGSLNYFAVAKAGILVFANWVHVNYIEKNFWINELWKAVMGSSYTLANLVADVFGGLASAVKNIKAGLSKVWNGIKAAGEYIQNVIISTILSSMSYAINQLISGSIAILNSFIPNSGMISNSTGNYFSLKGRLFKFELTSDQLGIFFNIGALSIGVKNIISPDISYETLSPGNVLYPAIVGDMTSFILLLIFSHMIKTNPDKQIQGNILALATVLASLVGYVLVLQKASQISDVNEKKQIYASFAIFNLASFLSTLYTFFMPKVTNKMSGLQNIVFEFIVKVLFILGAFLDIDFLTNISEYTSGEFSGMFNTKPKLYELMYFLGGLFGIYKTQILIESFFDVDAYLKIAGLVKSGEGLNRAGYLDHDPKSGAEKVKVTMAKNSVNQDKSNLTVGTIMFAFIAMNLILAIVSLNFYYNLE